VSNLWRLSLLFNGAHTEFDIDTGAEVSVISQSQHQKIGSPFLSPLGRRLRGPRNYSLPVTDGNVRICVELTKLNKSVLR